MDKKIKKIISENKKEGKDLKGLLKQDIKNDKKIATAQKSKKMTTKGKC